MSENHHDGNGWNEYQRYVLAEIKRIAKNTEDIRDATDKSNVQFVTLISRVELRVLDKIGKIDSEIATLKVKAGIWGLGGGIVAVLTTIGLWLVQQAMSVTH